jgi:hypothetical protein
MDATELAKYSAICGEVLALAHARSGRSAEIAGYIGTSASFDRAIVTFARLYADQVESDFEKFAAAIKVGRIRVDVDEVQRTDPEGEGAVAVT